MILNLKTFNEFLKFKHCKLESIEDTLDLIIEGCYFCSIDLKDSYYTGFPLVGESPLLPKKLACPPHCFDPKMPIL